jgi:hypothetical protein
MRRVAIVTTIALGVTAAVSSLAIVRAERFNPNSSKTYNCSSGTACVQGNASGNATDGIYGSASGSGTHGVYGTSNNAGVTGYTSSADGGSGVSGVSTSGSGFAYGVYGKSSNGPGVYGTTSVGGSNGSGVEGVTTATGSSGVYGYGKAATGNGAIGESNDSTGTNYAIDAQGDNKNTYLLYARGKGGAYCTINPSAALYCSGGVSGSVVRIEHRDSGGRRVLAYASESATATIQDTGTARMYDGVANVQIDPAFASVTDHRWYYLFLAPLGETRGLYVSIKTPSAFQVREIEHGRDSLAFDYRIVAHPLDAKNDHLPVAPAMQIRSKAIHPR